MLFHSAFIVLVLLVSVFTTSVLSAVLKGSDNTLSDKAKKDFVIDKVDQKLRNSNSDVRGVANEGDVDVSEPKSYSKEELKEEGRKKQQKPDIMTRILPMMIIPFMLQTAIIPMMLTMLKMMLIKSAFLGKMAILLGLLNMFRVANNQGGVYTHDIQLNGHEHMHEKVASEHYGYHGGEEYGAYVNRRKRNVR